jgi:hypothetical protein
VLPGYRLESRRLDLSVVADEARPRAIALMALELTQMDPIAEISATSEPADDTAAAERDQAGGLDEPAATWAEWSDSRPATGRFESAAPLSDIGASSGDDEAARRRTFEVGADVGGRYYLQRYTLAPSVRIAGRFKRLLANVRLSMTELTDEIEFLGDPPASGVFTAGTEVFGTVDVISATVGGGVRAVDARFGDDFGFALDPQLEAGYISMDGVSYSSDVTQHAESFTLAGLVSGRLSVDLGPLPLHIDAEFGYQYGFAAVGVSGVRGGFDGFLVGVNLGLGYAG